MSAVNLASAPVNKPGDRFSKLNHTDSQSSPAANNSNLSDSELKRMKIDEWASKNRKIPSRKLDLLASIIDLDEQSVEALLTTLQQTRAGISGNRKKSRSRRRRGLNVQTYLEREGMWKPQRARDAIEQLKQSAARHFAMNCKNPKKIDAILEIAGINTDPNQQTIVRL